MWCTRVMLLFILVCVKIMESQGATGIAFTIILSEYLPSGR